MPQTRDWKKAVENVHEIIAEYSELIGEPVVSPMAALAKLNALMVRYNQGERSAELYKSMMKAE